MSKLKNDIKKVMKATGVDKLYEPIRKRRYENMMANRRRHLKESGVELLKLVKEEFENNDLTFWIDFGTLLGAVREKDFIAHDFDIDISMPQNVDKDLVTKLLTDKGLVKKNDFLLDGEIVEQTYEYKGLMMDIFYCSIGKDKMEVFGFYPDGEPLIEKKNGYEAVKGWAGRKYVSTYNGFEKIEFKGIEFNAPKNVHLYLEENYGKDYMTPKKDWDYVNSPTNIEEIPSKDIIRYEYNEK